MTILGSSPDYMIKEIFDRPPGLRATIGGRVSPEDAAIHVAYEILLTDE
jgi:hypothetical protein